MNCYMNCYIYGAGQMYNRIISQVKSQDGLFIRGVVTTETPEHLSIDSYHRYSACEVNWKEAELVIIAVEKWMEIAEILHGFGVSDDKIIRGNVFLNPCFNLKDYISVRKSMPTIISNTCLGGRVYKELGLKMRSPTINCICLNDDEYINFIMSIENCMSKEMHVLENKADYYHENSYNREYFMAAGEVGENCKWLFPHDDVDTAISNWNRRKERINYNNLTYLMIAFSDDGARKFDALKVSRKLGFYYKNLGLESIIYTPEWNNPEIQRKYDYNYVMYVHRYATNIERMSRINWIEFLLDNNYLRW